MATSTHRLSSCSLLPSMQATTHRLVTNTDMYRLLNPSSKLQSGPSITLDISHTLSQCPSDFYIIVSQQGAESSDYTSRKNTPSLAQQLSSKLSSQLRSRTSIPEVLGDIDIDQWQHTLVSNCDVRIMNIDASTGTHPARYYARPSLIMLNFPPPSKDDRETDLALNDVFFASVLDVLPNSNYTVLYTTSTTSSTTRLVAGEGEYVMESEIQDSLHMDLKRSLGMRQNGKSSNQTIVDGPLFHKYQFLTPGEPKVLVLTYN